MAYGCVQTIDYTILTSKNDTMKRLLTGIVMMLSLSAYGQNIDSLQADTVADKAVDLQNVTITSRRSGTRRMTIETNVDQQRVTIIYDAEKTNSEAIIKSFDKFGYKATEVKAEKPAAKDKKK